MTAKSEINGKKVEYCEMIEDWVYSKKQPVTEQDRAEHRINESKSRMDKFSEVANPVIKFINDNHNPHTKIIIENNRADIVVGEMGMINDKFIKD